MDSDRYLSNVYSHLMKTMQPDAVIILGDLFSDGFRASGDQWLDYLKVSRARDVTHGTYLVYLSIVQFRIGIHYYSGKGPIGEGNFGLYREVSLSQG